MTCLAQPSLITLDEPAGFRIYEQPRRGFDHSNSSIKQGLEVFISELGDCWRSQTCLE